MASDLFGLELVFAAVGRDFKKKEDALIALAHWIAVKSGFKCIGLGDDKTVTGVETTSELLPAGWNASETYAIRYLRENDLFILRGIRTDNTLILNLLRTADLLVSNVALDIEDAVKSLHGSLNEIIPHHQALAIRFKRELVEPCSKETNKEATTQTPTTPRESIERQNAPRNPLAVQNPFAPGLPVGPCSGLLDTRDPMSPFNVGRADLDPLGGGGGGMLFNPFGAGPNRQNLPRGAIPGARYDPTGPFPPRSGGFGPDPDHLPRPGYDDIYM